MKGLLAIFFTLMFFNVNSQVDFIQGGGTLDDWANLAKYRSTNSEIINTPWHYHLFWILMRQKTLLIFHQT